MPWPAFTLSKSTSSGGTGPAVGLAEQVQTRLGYAPRVVLTDLFPNRAAFASATERSNVPVVAEAEPVDARAVPVRLEGVRTLFDGIVSCLRSYTVEELRDMCRGLETDTYRFHIGVKQSRGQRLTYLVGCEGPLPEWAGV